jgi:hypothetical protein
LYEYLYMLNLIFYTGYSKLKYSKLNLWTPISQIVNAMLLENQRPDDGGSKHSKTSVSFCQTTRRNIPEDSHRQHTLCLSTSNLLGKF